MTDDEALDSLDRHPVPTCAHPRAVGDVKEGRSHWTCPDCGKSWGYVTGEAGPVEAGA
jgi:transposase-like protein